MWQQFRSIGTFPCLRRAPQNGDDARSLQSTDCACSVGPTATVTNHMVIGARRCEGRIGEAFRFRAPPSTATR